MVLQDFGASRMPPVITSPTSPSAWQPTMEMEVTERITGLVMEGWRGEVGSSAQSYKLSIMAGLWKGALEGRVIVSFILGLYRYLGTFLMLH